MGKSTLLYRASPPGMFTTWDMRWANLQKKVAQSAFPCKLLTFELTQLNYLLSVVVLVVVFFSSIEGFMVVVVVFRTTTLFAIMRSPSRV